jgi:hypothetical protein
MQNEKKPKKLKPLFVQDLARIQGGKGEQQPVTVREPCETHTTLAYCEEACLCY